MTFQQVPRDIAAHYVRVQDYQAEALRITLRAWRDVNSGAISESWELMLPAVTGAVTSAQISAAESALIADGDMAVATGQYRLPTGFVDPEAVAGVASDGGDLASALYSPVITAKQQIAQGAPAPAALRAMKGEFEKIVSSLVADSGRQAAVAGNPLRFDGGYTRMLNPPSCKRCVILAGRWYRWNTGFQRHPRCDCVHIGVKSREWAADEGFIGDPYEYLSGLSDAEQDRFLGSGNAQAVRDGADIFQVVNATTKRTREGGPLSLDGLSTTYSTGRRGIYRGGVRLTPDGIYAQAAGDRAKALRMLEQYGYVLPGGQDPAGVLRGQREGYGQLGRGGTRVGARHAIELARATGIRHPTSRYTMTAAELRRFDAGAAWGAVREGRNPYGRGPLTDQIRRRAEVAYQTRVLGLYGAQHSTNPLR